ncbi:hypothetical protein BLA29_014892, partial [Euroglyphus maynei]
MLPYRRTKVHSLVITVVEANIQNDEKLSTVSGHLKCMKQRRMCTALKFDNYVKIGGDNDA